MSEISTSLSPKQRAHDFAVSGGKPPALFHSDSGAMEVGRTGAPETAYLMRQRGVFATLSDIGIANAHWIPRIRSPTQDFDFLNKNSINVHRCDWILQTKIYQRI